MNEFEHADRDHSEFTADSSAPEFERWLLSVSGAHTDAVTRSLDVDAALAEVERRASGVAPTSRSRRREQLAGALRLAVLVGAAVPMLLLLPWAGLAYAYVVAPALLVGWWFAESGAIERFAARRRPRTLDEWAAQLRHRALELAAFAEQLRNLRRRLRDTRARVQELATAAGVSGSSRPGPLAGIDRQLVVARRDLKKLIRLLTAAGDNAAQFAEDTARDPRAASLNVAPVFLELEPGRAGTLMRSVVLSLKLADDAAKIPLGAAATLLADLRNCFAEIQRSDDAVRRACRRVLADANGLHAAAADHVVGGLRIGPIYTGVARALLALSPHLRRPSKRAGVRAVLVRGLPGPGQQTRRPQLARATAAALTRGRTWTPTNDIDTTAPAEKGPNS